MSVSLKQLWILLKSCKTLPDFSMVLLWSYEKQPTLINFNPRVRVRVRNSNPNPNINPAHIDKLYQKINVTVGIGLEHQFHTSFTTINSFYNTHKLDKLNPCICNEYVMDILYWFPQGPRNCAFGNAFLLTTEVNTGFLNYHHLSAQL